jgi:hypothetical protein
MTTAAIATAAQSRTDWSIIKPGEAGDYRPSTIGMTSLIQRSSVSSS